MLRRRHVGENQQRRGLALHSWTGNAGRSNLAEGTRASGVTSGFAISSNTWDLDLGRPEPRAARHRPETLSTIRLPTAWRWPRRRHRRPSRPRRSPPSPPPQAPASFPRSPRHEGQDRAPGAEVIDDLARHEEIVRLGHHQKQNRAAFDPLKVVLVGKRGIDCRDVLQARVPSGIGHVPAATCRGKRSGSGRAPPDAVSRKAASARRKVSGLRSPWRSKPP